MRKQIREELKQISQKEYKEFSSKLIPESKPILGVRLPVLRDMAKKIAKTEWEDEIREYSGNYADIYFEEVMLRSMIIGYGTQADKDIHKALKYVKEFIPHIDNWSICDSFCVSFTIAQEYSETVWEFIQPYLYSDKEFEVRVGIILILDQFLKFNSKGKKLSRKRVITMQDIETNTLKETLENYSYLSEIMNILNRPYNQGYYAQMAVAWTTAEAFVTFPYETMQLLCNHCKMDDWTYNKALQKICESRNPSDEVKNMIRKMKRQKNIQ